ncbi:lysophospholipid acyltransferase family protein [Lutibacter sp.]|uniref:lysophospholipid acyltransferase family protein n=1 Tax=Lutibacter sp. TaxID=1925666 RepID=UPI0035665525
MNLLIYILVYPLIWFISILPFKVLYFISDIFYVIIYNVIGYRKKVVLDNLKLAFPEKPIEELLEIQKKFYHHFIDIFIEMIKSFTISKEEVYKHYKYPNIDFFTELYKDGKSVILVGPHYANWEWIMSLDSFVNYKGYAAYTKVNNPYFNNKILKSRKKFGTNLVPTSKIITEIIHNQKNNIQAMYGLLSDQSPMLKKSFYWRTFFNIKVPVHTGGEMLAKKYNMNVVYMNVKKVKRGYYETTFSLITNEASKHPDYELTDIFIDKVEKQIRKQPEYYFWTHKRFKHRDKAPKN